VAQPWFAPLGGAWRQATISYHRSHSMRYAVVLCIGGRESSLANARMLSRVFVSENVMISERCPRRDAASKGPDVQVLICTSHPKDLVVSPHHHRPSPPTPSRWR
jgi:hypothetical protein